jgi:TolB-like protein/Tfp pilus assembly protein PilF
MSAESSRAVFLSYASQDADVARRLCAALRAVGVEVWFDQNELVGGDAWDAKIRGQIKACALFVPLISAATQARREGYFRIEWKLAAQRTHAMAEGTPFLLPVMIDETPEPEALVPAEFREVQWTLVRPGVGGQVDAAAAEREVGAFCGRVKRLLEGATATRPQPGTSAAVTGAAMRREANAGAQASGRKAPPTLGRWVAAAAGLAVVVAAVALVFLRPAKVENVREKTLAVLPFTMARGDAEDEKLADGIADELLTQLSRTPGLRVSGSLSSFSFKGQKLTSAEIARRLDVAYLVAGSFEKSGTQVRVRPQLVNAADGTILWSETLTKELTNVFALQDEMAGLIARQLQLRFTASGRAARTVDPAAYALVQKARFLWQKRTDEDLAEAIASCEAAIRIDPNYAEAHAGLADAALVRGWYQSLEGVKDIGVLYARAREAANRALEIDPMLAEPHAALGALNMNEGRFEEAEREFQAALRLNPNYSYAHHWRGHLLAASGRLDEAVAAMERATQIDPMSLSALVIRALFLGQAGWHKEAVEVNTRALAIRLKTFLPADGTQALSLLMVGRREEAVSAARVVTADLTSKPRWWVDAAAIHVLRKTGHEAEAAEHGQRLLIARPGVDLFRLYVDVAMGRVDEALEILRRAPVPPTLRIYIYHSEIWEEVRRSPKFPETLKQRGWWEHYERGRESKARMQREGAGAR